MALATLRRRRDSSKSIGSCRYSLMHYLRRLRLASLFNITTTVLLIFLGRQQLVPTSLAMSTTPNVAVSRKQQQTRIAVIGGGITGAVVATELVKATATTQPQKVVLFDQGRRGPGGRASHRSVDPQTLSVLLPDDEDDNNDNAAKIANSAKKTYEFDHGCQFFRADSPAMQSLVDEWIQKGWVAPWSSARWGRLGTAPDFFGLPGGNNNDNSSDNNVVRSTKAGGGVYAGVGGMHQVPRQLLASCPNVTVHRGTRVSQVTPREDGKWDIWGTSGMAAFHDTSEGEARAAAPQILDTVDVVVVTDVSASQETWHRASAGLPREFIQQLSTLASRPRVPFFSCMVALKQPIRPHLKLDAFLGTSPLWCAICSNSKPGFTQQDDDGTAECWTLVSTPDFAVVQIQETSMRDPTTGAFRPQENDYLNVIPGPMLLKAFQEEVQSHLPNDVTVEAIYLQAQRWGSGLPAPTNHLSANHIVHVDGLDYVNHVENLVYDRPQTDEKDFVMDDERKLYYAGDFCSHCNPGFEAAALSGLDLARHLIQQNKK